MGKWVTSFGLGLFLCLATVAPFAAGAEYRTVKMSQSSAEFDVKNRVPYLSAEKQAAFKVKIVDGIVYDARGRVMDGHFGYVMDASGDIYVFRSGRLRHSSIVAGGPVAGAGEITIREGRVEDVDSDSGHYSTRAVYHQVLKELSEHGVTVR